MVGSGIYFKKPNLFMKLSLFLLFLISSSVAFAQLSPEPVKPLAGSLARGTWQAGLSVSRTPVSRSDVPGSGQIQPRVHYFVRDNWSVGVEGRLQSVNQETSYRGVGVTSRHYLLKTKNIAAFGQVGYFQGQTVARQYTFDKTDPAHPTLTRQQSRQPAGMVSVGAGIQYRLGRRWSAEIRLDRQNIGNSNRTAPDSGRWRGSVGLNCQIGR